MRIKFFEKIISSIYNKLGVESRLVYIRGLCDNVETDSLYSNIKENIMSIIYDETVEIIVDYYHHLRNHNKITGEERETRIKKIETLISEDRDIFIDGIFERYKMLESILSNKIDEIIELTKEILNNLFTEKGEILSTYGDLGKVKSIVYFSGDTHDGKMVSIIEFDTAKLIYKPRTAYPDIVYNEVLSMVSEGYIDMKTPKVLNYEDHSWHEFITQEECKSMAGVERYYTRAGIHLAVLYSLGSTDIHYENLIAHGEYPVIIDLETILKATFNKLGMGAVKNRIEDSVAATGMLPFFSESGVIDVGISALFMEESTSNKMKMYRLVECEELDFAFREEFITMRPTKNQLIYKEKNVDTSKAIEYLIKGFRHAMKRIIIHTENILEIFRGYSNNSFRIRQLLRPTQVYYKFITSSRNPETLKDEEKYDNIFNLFINKFEAGNYGYLRVLSEVEAMKKGHIPFYHTFLHSCDLYSGDGVVCENYYDLSPYETLEERLNLLDSKSIDNQIRYIRMSIASTGTTDSLITGEYSKAREKTGFNYNDLELELKKYIEKLIDYTIELPDGNIYLNMMIPAKEKFAVVPFSYDLYYSLGIPWLLYEYSRIYTGNEKVENIAIKLFDYCIHKCKFNLQKSSDQLNYSLFNGLGGFLYVMYNLYKRTKNNYYLDMVLLLFEEIFQQYSNKELIKDDLDYLGGLSGTLYLLEELAKADVNIFDKEKIIILERKYLELLSSYKQDLTEIGFAHGISGIVLPLSNMINQDKKVYALLRDLILLEDELIKNSEVPFTWCRGWTGLLQVRNKLHENLDVDKVEKDFLLDIIPNTLEKGFIEDMFSLKNLSLCHGMSGNIDVLLSAESKYDKTGLPLDIYNEISAIRWFKDSEYSWENFMLGNSGVAYSLLRILHNVPSILNLELVH